MVCSWFAALLFIYFIFQIICSQGIIRNVTNSIITTKKSLKRTPIEQNDKDSKFGYKGI